MFGIHSIEYDNLKSYFYLIAVYSDSRFFKKEKSFRNLNIFLNKKKKIKRREWLSWLEVNEIAEQVGVPVVPVLFQGNVNSLNEINYWMEEKMKDYSQIGETFPEVIFIFLICFFFLFHSIYFFFFFRKTNK